MEVKPTDVTVGVDKRDGIKLLGSSVEPSEDKRWVISHTVTVLG